MMDSLAQTTEHRRHFTICLWPSMVSVGNPIRSQEIDDQLGVNSLSIALTSNSPDLLKSDRLKSTDDEEGLHTLEESPNPVGDDSTEPALAKEIINSTAHQVFDKMATSMGSREIEVSMETGEIVQPGSILTGNSCNYRDQILSRIRELGNVYVKTNDGDEMLCFNPGGLFFMTGSYGLLEVLPKSRGQGPIVAKESISEVAHKVFDKMSAQIESEEIKIKSDMSKEIDGSIQLIGIVAAWKMMING